MDKITKKFQTKSDFTDTRAYKHGLQEKYRDILNQAQNIDNIDAKMLGMLTNSFKPI